MSATATVVTSCSADRASVYAPAVDSPMPTGNSARSAEAAQRWVRSRCHCSATRTTMSDVGRNIATVASRAPSRPWAR